MTADELRAARLKLGLCQWELALALGYRKYDTVGRWERGQAPIPIVAELALRLLLSERPPHMPKGRAGKDWQKRTKKSSH